MNLFKAVSYIECWFKTFNDEPETKESLKKAFVEFIEEM